MKNALNWFEIPATDLQRATQFYNTIFDTQLINPEMEGMEMAMFPSEADTVGGAICAGELYQPSMEGSLVYLNGGDNLSTVLDRVPQAGGNVLMPKTEIPGGHGFMAIFSDSEGNRIALHSMQ